MAHERQLPEQRNPLVEEEKAPAYEILVERRCLGQTELKVRPGQVGTSSATMPDNLGMLDYAHLRVPLPKDLSSSGIFARGANKKYPEAYFLMRRSSDGFISATGMFKAAFPYALVEDEAAEKEYMKTLSGTSSEEVAGNVWIDPDQALALADEYGLRIRIEALLDPEPITHGTSDPSKSISSPPTYHVKRQQTNGASRSPKSEKKSSSAAGRRSTRVRSVSPTKKPATATTPGRKMATPKSRRGRTTRSSVEPGESSVNGDVTTTTTTTTTMTKKMTENIRTVIDTLAEEAEEATSSSTNRLSFGDKLPDPKALIADARKFVADATTNLVGSHSSSSAVQKLTTTAKNAEKSTEKTAARVRTKGKRKAEEMLEDVGEEVAHAKQQQHSLLGHSGDQHLNKRLRTEVDTRRERLRRRAAVGIGATLAVGGLVPVISSLIPLALSAFGQ